MAKKVLHNVTGLAEHLVARIHLQCRQDRERAARLRSLVTAHQSPDSRESKFIIARILVTLGVAGMLWGEEEDNETIARLAKEQVQMIKVIQAPDHRLDAVEAHELALSKALEDEVEQEELVELTYQAAMGTEDPHLFFSRIPTCDV